ncbi:DUF3828 domain-containing protein [Orrella marina]|uniref:Lipoprotein n=1 Tax=Orrella marina TaxID=2163011 RepID=A0A2R4XH86_9BURK|nr:DUF3828 domain-containing protein [Orrella marina]AWB33175.1 hypothetical protein DBV39_05015 [Orrella marina]
MAENSDGPWPGIQTGLSIPGRQLILACTSLVVAFALMGCASKLVNDQEAVSQREAVHEFYDQVITLNIHGLPDKAEMSQLAPLMSGRLVSLLETAKAHEARELGLHRGTEPPLIQGSVFVSLFEGASRVIAIEPDDTPNMWAVTLAYGQPGTDEFDWTDEVLLTKESGKWVVDDIDLLGQWDFARTGWLSNSLIISQTEPSR